MLRVHKYPFVIATLIHQLHPCSFSVPLSVMPRDNLPPLEPISGPRKQILTEKAKDAAQVQLSKRVQQDTHVRDYIYSVSGISKVYSFTHFKLT